jgi:hypothetical protein
MKFTKSVCFEDIDPRLHISIATSDAPFGHHRFVVTCDAREPKLFAFAHREV